MKGLATAVNVVVCVVLCLGTACNNVGVESVRADYPMVSNSYERFRANEQLEANSSDALMRDFDLFLVETANKLNAKKREGVPDVIIKARPGSVLVSNYDSVSLKGSIVAELCVSFDGDDQNIREHKRALHALGAIRMNFNMVVDENRRAYDATSTHLFFADFDGDHWIICRDTDELIKRKIPVEVVYEMQDLAINTLERHIER